MTIPSYDILHSSDAWRNKEIYQEIYDYSMINPEDYWMSQIDQILWTNIPKIPTQIASNGATLWFPDGKVNACYNCVDRYSNAKPDAIAIIWQSEKLDICECITYKKLKEEVCKFANTLTILGVTRSDFVTIYMPMVPEAIYACLACTRLGIVYTAVFAGFSPNAIAMRMQDSNRSNFIITVDANTRGGKIIPMKSNVDYARKLLQYPVRCLVIRRIGTDINWDDRYDIDYYETSKNVSTDCPISDTSATDKLFILYTSGSSGKPKGITMSTGGFLLFSMLTGKYFFNMFEGEIFWGSGDIGWMGGHAYALYAALCNGITSVFYEGIPTYPRKSIFWEIIDKHKITSFNSAPTAIRAMMQYSEESLSNTSRDSLKYLGIFGEILNKEAWYWYFNSVGKGRCPVVNMWGQTELGGVPTAPLSCLDEMKTYGHIGRQFFGCKLILKDENDMTITKAETKGSLFIKYPMPGMLIDIVNGSLKDTYYSQTSENLYCCGDEAYFDCDGNFWITGRNDDVLNVSGHRISPIEIEEVISQLDIVAEVCVIGYPHPIKGEGIYAFVVLKKDIDKEIRLSATTIINNHIQTISNHVKDTISPITKPDVIVFVPDLPKTRSGKILRRILRHLASSNTEDCEDFTTINNPDCVQEILNTIKKR